MLRIKFIVVVIVLILLMPLKINAEGIGVEITPAFKELSLKPGESITDTFKINNNNEFDLNFSLSLAELKDEELIIDSGESSSSARWVSFEQSEYQIKSFNSAEVKFTITIPSDAVQSLFNPIILVKVLSTSSEQGANTSINQYIPYQISLRVSEKEEYNANLEIVNFYPQNNTFVFGNFTNITFDVLNSSNDVAKPLIRSQVVNPKKEIILQNVSNESLKPLQSSQKFTTNFQYDFDINNSVNWGINNIEVLVTDSLSNKTITQRVSFIVIPYYIIIAIILLIILVLIIFSAKKKKKSTKRFHQYRK